MTLWVITLSFRAALIKLWSPHQLWTSRSALVVLKKHKVKLKWIAYCTIAENLRVWRWHMAIAFYFFSQYSHLWNLLPLPIYRFPTLLSATKEGFKHYERERGVSRHLFSDHLAPRLSPSQGLPEFKTDDQNTGPFHVSMTSLIVLPTSSLHIEMLMYCTSYTNNRTRQIAYTVSILVLKYAIKLINLLSKGTRIRRSAEMLWHKKRSPLKKSLRNSALKD